MTERRQQMLVGLFVLCGLIALGIMTVLFGEAPQWLGGKQYTVMISFNELSDVQQGTAVKMRGIQIGRVRSLELKNRQHPEQGTYVLADIDREYVIPVGASARVRPAAIGFGRSDIIIEVPKVASEGFLPTDGKAILPGSMGSPLDSIIPERMVATLETTAGHIGELARELTPVATDLHQILRIRTIEELDEAQAQGRPSMPNLYSAVQRLYLVLTHLDNVIGDPAVRSNVKVAIENFKDVSVEAKAAAKDVRALAARGGGIETKLENTLDTARDRIDELARKLMHNSDQLAVTLEHLSRASADLSEGQGTLGLLLRDPKLYDELVFTVRKLKEAIGEIQALVDKLQQKGLWYKG
ncbi:MAG: MlaD family protein [Phycisphaerae bacterium]